MPTHRKSEDDSPKLGKRKEHRDETLLVSNQKNGSIRPQSAYVGRDQKISSEIDSRSRVSDSETPNAKPFSATSIMSSASIHKRKSHRLFYKQPETDNQISSNASDEFEIEQE